MKCSVEEAYRSTCWKPASLTGLQVDDPGSGSGLREVLDRALTARHKQPLRSGARTQHNPRVGRPYQGLCEARSAKPHRKRRKSSRTRSLPTNWRFLDFFPGCDSGTPHNGVRLAFQPQGLRPSIENGEIVAAHIIQRVHHEVAAKPSDETLKRFLEELLSYPDVPSRWRMLDLGDTPPPFLTINYRWKNSTVRLYSALTTFGTALDIALHELRVETFFPADEATRAALTAAR